MLRSDAIILPCCHDVSLSGCHAFMLPSFHLAAREKMTAWATPLQLRDLRKPLSSLPSLLINLPSLSHNRARRALLPTVPQLSIKRRPRPPLRLIPQRHKAVVEERIGIPLDLEHLVQAPPLEENQTRPRGTRANPHGPDGPTVGRGPDFIVR